MLRHLVTAVAIALALTTVAMTTVAKEPVATETGDSTSRLSGRDSKPDYSRYARGKNYSVAMAARLHSFQNPVASTDDVTDREPADPCKAGRHTILSSPVLPPSSVRFDSGNERVNSSHLSPLQRNLSGSSGPARGGFTGGTRAPLECLAPPIGHRTLVHPFLATILVQVEK